MSVRYYVRRKPLTLDEICYPNTNVPLCADTEMVLQRECACPCGARWWADAGTETRCDGGRVHLLCPLASRAFKVPA